MQRERRCGLPVETLYPAPASPCSRSRRIDGNHDRKIALVVVRVWLIVHSKKKFSDDVRWYDRGKERPDKACPDAAGDPMTRTILRRTEVPVQSIIEEPSPPRIAISGSTARAICVYRARGPMQGGQGSRIKHSCHLGPRELSRCAPSSGIRAP